jgi:hypothetical protein
MADFDRYLGLCEDREERRYARDIEEAERLEAESKADEYGRPPEHPDHGYRGESLSSCPACKWRGDPYGSEFCPMCRETLEVES